jgi:DNA-directed RNA polymerase specialized sigma24 family protein
VSPPSPDPAGRASGADPDGSGAPGTPAARRRAVRALGDAALAAALAGGDDAAWAEFDARFRPVLETYVRRVRVPSVYWSRCVDDVLADEAMRLSEGAPVPDAPAAYLVRSAYHALLKCRREEARRAARHAVLAADADPCTPAAPDPDATAPALDALVDAVAAGLTDAERQLLVWVGEQVPRRQIAAWLGDGYEATRKRVQRLVARLQAEGRRYAATCSARERHEIERFLRRAGHAAPGASTVPRTGAARAAGPASTTGRAAPPAEASP